MKVHFPEAKMRTGALGIWGQAALVIAEEFNELAAILGISEEADGHKGVI